MLRCAWAIKIDAFNPVGRRTHRARPCSSSAAGRQPDAIEDVRRVFAAPKTKQLWLVPGAFHAKCREYAGLEYEPRVGFFARTYAARPPLGQGRLARLTSAWRRKGLRIGFVPTMGALHAGHAELVSRAAAENDRVVVSVFVNPLQFGPNEDYGRYPRALPADRLLVAEAGADIVYAPSVAKMYPEGFRTHVEVEGLSGLYCGKYRPGHFRGVATVVLKLFNQVRPDRAYFGEKDFQQLGIVKKMVRIWIRGDRARADIREDDGLAQPQRLPPPEASPRPGPALARGVEPAQATPRTVSAAVASSPEPRCGCNTPPSSMPPPSSPPPTFAAGAGSWRRPPWARPA